MILPEGCVSKKQVDILDTDRIIGVDSRHAFTSGFRYWVLEHGYTPEETRDA